MPTKDRSTAINRHLEETLSASYPTGIRDIAGPLQQVLKTRSETEWTARVQALVSSSETYR